MSKSSKARRDRRRTLLERNAHRAVQGAVGAQMVRAAAPATSRDEMLDVITMHDGYAPMRDGLRRIGRDRDLWAGVPMPMKHHRLIVEPTYPRAAELNAFGADDEPAPPEDEALCKLRNVFWSWKWRSHVYVWNEPDGRLAWNVDKQPSHGIGFALSTLGASSAWGIEQEARAVQKLGELLRHHIFKQYMLTGTFLEKSQRSGVMYLFRRLRPTVAISMREGHDLHGRPRKGMRILAALCLHPIALYADSWAGAMCPTDDVIAHLMLMRGDEAMFWRRANQHPPFHRQAGLAD